MFFKSIYIFEIKYGIKIWTLANAKIYYCCNFDIFWEKYWKYRWKNQANRMDNFFYRLFIVEDLLKEKIFLVGKIRKNGEDLSKFININIYNQ